MQWSVKSTPKDVLLNYVLRHIFVTAFIISGRDFRKYGSAKVNKIGSTAGSKENNMFVAFNTISSLSTKLNQPAAKWYIMVGPQKIPTAHVNSVRSKNDWRRVFAGLQLGVASEKKSGCYCTVAQRALDKTAAMAKFTRGTGQPRGQFFTSNLWVAEKSLKSSKFALARSGGRFATYGNCGYIPQLCTLTG